jgi:uncharacterized membrane protein YbaN (DUF454 family)
VKAFYLIVGWTACALGTLGIFLPILPTTPFLILAAFCFSKSSPKTREWLLSNALLGQPIRDWEEKKIIRKKPKILATGMILVSALILFSKEQPAPYIKVPVLMVLFCVIIFIISRPSEEKQKSYSDQGEQN